MVRIAREAEAPHNQKNYTTKFSKVQQNLSKFQEQISRSVIRHHWTCCQFRCQSQRRSKRPNSVFMRQHDFKRMPADGIEPARFWNHWIFSVALAAGKTRAGWRDRDGWNFLIENGEHPRYA